MNEMRTTNTFIYIHIYIHTCNTYIHTYIHTYTHTYNSYTHTHTESNRRHTRLSITISAETTSPYKPNISFTCSSSTFRVRFFTWRMVWGGVLQQKNKAKTFGENHRREGTTNIAVVRKRVREVNEWVRVYFERRRGDFDLERDLLLLYVEDKKCV